jgi:hypothetical protein
MVAGRLVTAIEEQHPDEKQPSIRMEKELRDIVQQAEHASEIVRTEAPGWYYWMPYPGVRYYCHEPWPPPLARSGRSRGDAPAGR